MKINELTQKTAILSLLTQFVDTEQTKDLKTAMALAEAYELNDFLSQQLDRFEVQDAIGRCPVPLIHALVGQTNHCWNVIW